MSTRTKLCLTLAALPGTKGLFGAFVLHRPQKGQNATGI